MLWKTELKAVGAFLVIWMAGGQFSVKLHRAHSRGVSRWELGSFLRACQWLLQGKGCASSTSVLLETPRKYLGVNLPARDNMGTKRGWRGVRSSGRGVSRPGWRGPFTKADNSISHLYKWRIVSSIFELCPPLMIWHLHGGCSCLSSPQQLSTSRVWLSQGSSLCLWHPLIKLWQLLTMEKKNTGGKKPSLHSH